MVSSSLFIPYFMTLSVSDDRLIYEWQIGKDLEGSGHGLFEVLTQHLSRGADIKHVKLREDC
jgi:hypothetical protein